MSAEEAITSAPAGAARTREPQSGGGPAPASNFRLALATFTDNRSALVGVVLVVALAVFCFIGPLFYHTNQVNTNLFAVHEVPGTPGHPLGTDELGYDELGRLMAGGRTSLEVGVAAGLMATVVGSLWGAVSGYFGGAVDAVMMRVVDALLSIPALFLLLVVAAIWTPSVPSLVVLIGLIAWLVPARLVRGEALTLRVREYVQAVRMMGGGHGWAVMRHVLPNTLGTVLVNASFQVADAIIYLAYLSFLGLGLPPPATDWGGMLTNGIQYTFDGYWWLIYPPGVAIILVVMAFNFIGDGLRDAVDARLRQR
ncbi:MAG TPA: ABC transporter permease [Trebonia sp.]|jgi:peptide/nickel transport system permease protein|nr:ABC transporter permease [Trebonia sp.]